ncbi:MAG: hypothetical protein JJT87_19245 [Halomonas sp.]|nr:hypothetical protein [Halomonas sp.]MCC5904052.1 hypothetical protein [Halomonas sp.]
MAYNKKRIMNFLIRLKKKYELLLVCFVTSVVVGFLIGAVGVENLGGLASVGVLIVAIFAFLEAKKQLGIMREQTYQWRVQDSSRLLEEIQEEISSWESLDSISIEMLRENYAWRKVFKNKDEVAPFTVFDFDNMTHLNSVDYNLSKGRVVRSLGKVKLNLDQLGIDSSLIVDLILILNGVRDVLGYAIYIRKTKYINVKKSTEIYNRKCEALITHVYRGVQSLNERGVQSDMHKDRIVGTLLDEIQVVAHSSQPKK